MNSININGNTYPVRDQIKSLGCRWDITRKCWTASTDDMAAKARALVGGQPMMNNPIAVPQDLGPIDVAAECAKHRRIPKGTATVLFRRPSEKGEASVLGDTFWGRDGTHRDRYIIVLAGRPYYLSAETLEDNDDFSSDGGWYRSVHAVAVEPTNDEIASDPVKLKADKEAAEKAAQAKAEAERAARVAANQPRLAEIAALVAQSKVTGGEGGMCQVYWDGGGDGGRYGRTGVRLYACDGGLIYWSEATNRPGEVYPDGSGGRMQGRYLADSSLAAEAMRLAEVTPCYLR